MDFRVYDHHGRSRAAGRQAWHQRMAENSHLETVSQGRDRELTVIVLGFYKLKASFQSSSMPWGVSIQVHEPILIKPPLWSFVCSRKQMLGSRMCCRMKEIVLNMIGFCILLLCFMVLFISYTVGDRRTKRSL